VQYVLQAPNIQKLKDVIPPFLEEVRQEPAFAFADVDLKFNKPELRVTIERERAESMGVSPRDVAQTLQLAAIRFAPGAIAQPVRRMIADLLKAQQERQDDAAPLHAFFGSA